MYLLRAMLRLASFGPLAGLLVSGCAHRAGQTPFIATVNGTGSACSVQVAGQDVTSDQLLEIARREVAKTRRAQLVGGAEVPYRCIGGVVYTLQTAGFSHVDFSTAAASNNP